MFLISDGYTHSQAVTLATARRLANLMKQDNPNRVVRITTPYGKVINV